ncbi:hypothetical protein [Porphyromonas sp.]|uniref:hypothetical protein n=1 Tax=Porphyromonas sp. TaxID=1924944 RepID=UPI0026DD38CB|nr:hypothetical protein [Porphyromonas sp.]MDO4770768.1 hypothetical protein [Porphyromonas sp.]
MKNIVGGLLAIVCLMNGYGCSGTKKSGSTQQEESDTVKYTTFKVRYDEETGGNTGNRHSPIFRTKNKHITWNLEDYDRDMTCDLNGDGREDETLSFEIDPETGSLPVGLLYRRGEVMQDFLPDVKDRISDWWEELSAEYVNFEMTYYDFDKDGVPELIISLCDYGGASMKAFVYRWTNKDPRRPWEFLADVAGQSQMYLDERGDVVAPFGSQGLYYCYRFDGKEFVEVDSSFSESE